MVFNGGSFLCFAIGLFSLGAVFVIAAASRGENVFENLLSCIFFGQGSIFSLLNKLPLKSPLTFNKLTEKKRSNTEETDNHMKQCARILASVTCYVTSCLLY